MKKVLILASVASMVDQFNMVNIDILIKMGYEVDVAANFIEGNTCSIERITEFKKELETKSIRYYQVDFSRKITNFLQNIEAYKQIKTLIQKNRYEFIHCHSPIGGLCGRLAGRATGTKVIYTAHGFHFFKGAPLINWLLYYPIERFLARYTDVLITINKEDYAIAKKFKAKKVKYVPGVGVDTKRFEVLPTYRDAKRTELGIKDDQIVFVSIGELNKGKNHENVIRALSHLPFQNFVYLICGIGFLDRYLLSLAKRLGLEKRVLLLGFRKDIPEILSAADVFLFPSLREGLPVALMEAMAANLPCIASKIRGNIDLLQNGEGGFMCSPGDVVCFANAIKRLYEAYDLRRKMGAVNMKNIKLFGKDKIYNLMKAIYIEES
jgi:glycosyltransferase involved in cell wall biosynthesis